MKISQKRKKTKKKMKKNVNKMELTPITDFDFLKKLKGCGIKYYSKIPRTQLKALLGFCPTTKTKRKIEINSNF